jgi:hypothetical protein
MPDVGKVLWTGVRLLSAGVVLLAIVVQSSALAGEGVFDPTRFYAFFTIQSNLIGVAALVWAFRRRNAPPGRGLDLFRGAAAAYLTVTFFVVILFLSEVDVSLQLVWVDVVLHKIFPVIVVLDWILYPPGTRLRYADALRWLIYPVIWLGFTLVRGAADGWYPYPFLDPANGGYGMVATVVAGIIIGFLALSAVYIWLGNWRSAVADGSETPADGEEPKPPAPPEPPGWEGTGPEGPGTPGMRG